VINHLDINGMIPATILPMGEDYLPDYGAYKGYLEWLISQNAFGFAVNMDTGEGPQLSVAERLEVVRAAKEISRGNYPVLAGLMGGATGDAIALAKEFATAGADGLVVFPNAAFRNQPLDPRIPVEYHRAVAEGSGLPIVLFQLAPVFGGVNYPRQVLLELLRIPQVIGIKEASFDIAYFSETVETLMMGDHPVTLLTGNDRFITESFLLGATGALLGFAAVGCGLVAEQIASLQRGEIQQLIERRRVVQSFANFIYRDPVLDYRARCKAALARLGVIPANRILVRPPLFPVPADEFPALDQALVEAGLLSR
jgi:4-hydroxy-tetrahydrodipicolinate synthase